MVFINYSWPDLERFVIISESLNGLAMIDGSKRFIDLKSIVIVILLNFKIILQYVFVKFMDFQCYDFINYFQDVLLVIRFILYCCLQGFPS